MKKKTPNDPETENGHVQLIRLRKLIQLNPFKHSVIFMGHRQTVQNQIRHRRRLCLIRLCTVYLENVLLNNLNELETYYPEIF